MRGWDGAEGGGGEIKAVRYTVTQHHQRGLFSTNKVVDAEKLYSISLTLEDLFAK